MKLSAKVAVFFSLVFSCLLLALFVSGRHIIKQGFAAVEETTARLNAARLQQAAWALNDRLKMLTADWACWDDSYTFIQDRNRAYVESNIHLTTFENSDLHSIVFLDPEGNLVAGYTFDPETEIISPINPALADYLQAHRDRFKLEPGQFLSGLIAIPKATLLTTACPILTSKGEGPCRGTLIMTRLLDTRSFAEATKVLLMDTSTYSLRDTEPQHRVIFPPFNSRAIGENVYIREADKSTLVVTTSLNDLDGQPAIALNLRSPRRVVRQQELALKTLTISLLVMGLVFGTFGLLALHGLVSVRIANLHKQIMRVKQLGRLDTPFIDQGKDEIAEMGRSFNDMIAALAQSRLAMEKSDRHKQELLDSLHVGVIIIDAETHRILETNQFALSMIGLPKESVCGAICQHFICPTVNGKCPVSDLHQNMDLTETVLLAANGKEVPILKSVIPVAHDGRKLHIESFVDISAQKKVERELRNRLEIESALAAVSADMASATSLNLDSVIQAALHKIGELTGIDQIGVFLLDPDQQSVSNTHEWCSPGISPQIDRLQNLKLTDFPHWVQVLREQKSLLIADTRAEGAEWDNERRLMLSHGDQTFLAVPLLSGHQVIGCVGFSSKKTHRLWGNEDIGLLNMLAGTIASALNRKSAEEAIRQSAEQYQAIFDNSGASIIVDPENNIQLANREFLDLVGLPKDKVLRTSWTRFVHPDHLREASEKWQALVEGKSNHAMFTLTLKTHHFTTTCAQTSISALPGSRQWVVSFVDVTAHEQAERHLQEANRIKSEFLANISHEVRTPLNSVIGYTEIIKDGSRDESTRKYAEIVLHASEDLLTMFQEILDAAHLDAGKVILRHTAFSLNKLLGRIEDTVRLLTRPKQLAFSVQMDPAIPEFLVGDEARLKQVLVNLLTNAIKFTEKGGVALHIEMASAHPMTIRYSVVDTGIGIPRDKQATIFESFTQADGGISRKYGGTGLGTTIAQKLVNLMGGQIRVKSEPGRGSTFWFEILQHAAETLPVEIEEDEPLPADTHARILVAEDSIEIQTMVKLHLDQSGYETCSASNGLEALQQCEQHAFDLILMDLQMPEMDGIEAVRCIRAGPTANRYTPIVGITAFAGSDIKERCTTAGFNDLLIKPFRKKDFFQTLERWILKQTTEKTPDTKSPEIDLQPADTLDGSIQEPAPFLYAQALYEFSGNKSLLQSVVHQFIGTIPNQMKAMHDALAGNDPETIRRHAHKISGSAANLTAYAMARVAAAIEQHLVAGDLNPVAPALDQLALEYKRLQEFVFDIEELDQH